MKLNRHYNRCGETPLARAHRTGHALAGILKTRYPGFLLGLPLSHREIPIFIYHDVEPDGFAKDLEFLRANGYRTLALDEFITLSAGKSGGGRHVLLTFDDARRSFYEAGLPLLRAFGAHATLFVPTYWMSAPIPDRELFMTWAQVRECVASGLVDVQSHAHRHALVYTSGRLIGFASPPLLRRYDIYDWPMRHTAEGDRLGKPAPGSPIYQASPLLSAATRFLESAGLTEACTRWVERSGGEDFFSRQNWASSLHRLYESRSAVLQGERMEDADFHKLLASEFELARAEFLTHLGYAPTSLAYPWMLGSRRSLELARRFGIRTVFGVAIDYRRARDRRMPLRAFGRLKADWLRLLPGQGRASFLSVAVRKIGAFSKIQHLAH